MAGKYMRSPKLSGFDSITFLLLLSGSIVILLFDKSNPYPGDNNIDDCQRYQRLPAQIHQLVVAETRQGPSHPHKKEYEGKYFYKQRYNAQNGYPIFG